MAQAHLHRWVPGNRRHRPPPDKYFDQRIEMRYKWIHTIGAQIRDKLPNHLHNPDQAKTTQQKVDDVIRYLPSQHFKDTFQPEDYRLMLGPGTTGVHFQHPLDSPVFLREVLHGERCSPSSAHVRRLLAEHIVTSFAGPMHMHAFSKHILSGPTMYILNGIHAPW